MILNNIPSLTPVSENNPNGNIDGAGNIIDNENASNINQSLGNTASHAQNTKITLLNLKQQYPQITKLTPEMHASIVDPFIMHGLDHLICYSLSQVQEFELRKKMANCILVVGGGCHIYNIVEEFEDRIIDTIQHYDNNIDRIEVINTYAREVPPSNLSWIGATIIQRLESMKELWISRKRWIAEADVEDDED